MQRILLTSFRTWLPHQKSNSSDDLLAAIAPLFALDTTCELVLWRHLPVDIALAAAEVKRAIAKVQPTALVCCGMAENRKGLAIEVQAFPVINPSQPSPEPSQSKAILSTANIPQLSKGLVATTLSYNAGKFVCEGLYYEVLSYLTQSPHPLPCIFVHIPLLTPENQEAIMADFCSILKNLDNSVDTPRCERAGILNSATDL